MKLGFLKRIGYGILIISGLTILFQVTVLKKHRSNDVVSFRARDISHRQYGWNRNIMESQHDGLSQLSGTRGEVVVQKPNKTLYFSSVEREDSRGSPYYGQRRISYQDFLNQPSVDLTKLRSNWRADARIIQNASNKKRYLTIGIPTVKREKDEYILNTVQSIVNCTRKEELQEIYIVVFLADFDEDWKANISKHLRQQFGDIISMGTLHVIQAWDSFYPPLDNLKHTFVDPETKKKWRAKQNVDYAFLFMYSQVLATYYIQMEDDIYTVPGYFKVIKDYVKKFKERWVCLEFSELGFIGKLYHSEDIDKLAKMVLLFYAQQPCDVTYLNFNVQMLQFKRHIRRPTIFEHVGYHSSLPGKIQPLKDRFFEEHQKSIKGDNPPAKLYTSLPFEGYFNPDKAYRREEGIFWSSKNGRANDWFSVVFDEPQLLSKIVIHTGIKSHPGDKIHFAKLEASLASTPRGPGKPECSRNKLLGYFEDGDIELNEVRSITGEEKIHCLNIIITNKQETWVIVREIAVFTVHHEIKQTTKNLGDS
ncbi:alpha-1,3-mannosyl-glycoprotein 4-beta-N-acetylglucosaminyltransferase C-like [Ostrea edulis]|uniref:alpha-1,3-mannosyl-glycoprotein 4-beta-N-acetylglucosaminyltransferase C-like n=1 Tax=Ostrea edulis TaxID=37623 RepID=UPI0024AF303B|nr:alpha-1,3-mannosyl-glycoprotein 4-beta-N-acetylglucosaminyltransferase C-like [Ostrea edulis]